MHYAFDAEAKVRQMLENVSKYLRVGGMFIGTTPSSKKILYVAPAVSVAALPLTCCDRELLDAIPSDAEDLLIGNGYYQLVFEERHHEGLYGHAYRYTLVDAVDDVTEWIVYWKEFEECVPVTMTMTPIMLTKSLADWLQNTVSSGST